MRRGLGLLLLACSAYGLLLDIIKSKLNKPPAFNIPVQEKLQNFGDALADLGIDLQQRKARLEGLSKFVGNEKFAKQFGNENDPSLKLRTFQLETFPNSTLENLFEVNQKEGIAEYLFQGDILLTEDQLSDIESDFEEKDSVTRRDKRVAAPLYNKWIGNVVYYYFDASLNQRKRNSVYAAVEYLESRTCIKFVYSSTASNRIRIFNGVGCYATIGMIGGQQQLSLGDGCEDMGTVAHELTHALAFWHTHMRSDRNEFVRIDLSTVPENQHHNFIKLETNQEIRYTPYEYGSFMHYSANSFVSNPNSISVIPTDPAYLFTIGSAQITFYDVMMINDHYGCSVQCPPSSVKCQNGGVPNPRNCSRCNCPAGYGGQHCTQRPVGCGESLTATSFWQSKSFSFGNVNDNVTTRDTFAYCNHWISAPQGNHIEIRISSMFNPQCKYGCPFNGIEIKTEAEEQKTNRRVCCNEFVNTVYRSNLNPTPVVSYNRFYYTSFTLEYRYVNSTYSVPLTSCKNIHLDKDCEDGYCFDPNNSFQLKKYYCAKTCNLCGKAASPCVDLYNDCATLKEGGECATMEPFFAEYHCAATCGFCRKPN